MHADVKRLLLWLPVVAWCGLIFFLSSIPDLKSDFEADFLLRKGAHVTEYAVLWLLTRNAFAGTMPGRGARFAGVAAFLFAVLYAVSDEFHQSFVPGRGPSAADVTVDAAGALAGAGICRLLGRIALPGSIREKQ